MFARQVDDEWCNVVSIAQWNARSAHSHVWNFSFDKNVHLLSYNGELFHCSCYDIHSNVQSAREHSAEQATYAL